MRAWQLPECKPGLGEKIGIWITRDADMVDVMNADSGLTQAETDGVYREAGPVLYAREALFFDGRD